MRRCNPILNKPKDGFFSSHKALGKEAASGEATEKQYD